MAVKTCLRRGGAPWLAKAQAFTYSTGTERPKANANIKNVAPKKIPTRPPVIDMPSLSPFARMRMPSRANSKASPTKLDAVLILSNRLLISIFAAFPSFSPLSCGYKG